MAATLVELERAGMARLQANHKALSEAHEDILQEALIAMIDAPEADEPLALMNAIIDRRAIDVYRSVTRRLDVEVASGGLTELDALAYPPIPDNDRNIFATHLTEAIRALPTAQRETYILCQMRGLSTYEAAEFLALPRTTVQWRLRAALDALEAKVG